MKAQFSFALRTHVLGTVTSKTSTSYAILEQCYMRKQKYDVGSGWSLNDKKRDETKRLSDVERAS